MNIKNQRLVVALTLAGMLSACGGEQNQDTETTLSSKSIQYSGSVTDENGVPIEGLSIQLENRITDEKTRILTASDGNFSTQIDPGVYEILFHDSKDSKYISRQMTAVNLQKDEKESIRLQPASKIESNLFTGMVRHVNGTPAMHRKIIILPLVARSTEETGKAEIPDPFILRTDAQGKYSVALGKPGMGIDFDALLVAEDAPEIDIRTLAISHQFSSEEEKTAHQHMLDSFFENHIQEHLDIEKPSGAMQMDMVFGADVRNLRGTTGVPSAIPADLVLLAKQNTGENLSFRTAWAAAKNYAANTLLKIIPSAEAGILIKRFFFAPGDLVDGKIKKGFFVGGKIDVAKTEQCNYTSLLDMTEAFDRFDSASLITAARTRLCVVKNPFPIIFSYKIQIYSDKSSTFIFTDETNDTYSLRIFNTFSDHYLRYNSSNPAIIDVEYLIY